MPAGSPTQKSKKTKEVNMNTLKAYTPVIVIMMVSLFLAGCAAPIPASTPVVCPTNAPLSCPTSIADIPATPNRWRADFSVNFANVLITFDPGDKCTMDVKKTISSKAWSYEIVVNDQAHQNYMVGALQLEEGKTLKDLEDYNKNHANNPPPWSTLTMFEIVEPNSSTFHGITLTGSPVYFVCQVQGPDSLQIIATFGPVKILE
jgi:hypothetical protein